MQAVKENAPASTDVRSAVLNSIKQGYNTLPAMRRQTGFSDRELLHEIEILEELEIERKLGPPITSFWIKGKAPKGRVYISAGSKAVEVVEEPAKIKPNIPEQAKAQSQNGDVLKVLLDSIETKDIYRERVPVGSIIPNPDNPRGWVDVQEQSFLDLAASIKEIGIQEPLVITPSENGLFRNVMGHRRFAAAVRAGLTEVPCLIRLYADKNAEIEAMLVENIQRKDLTPLQESKAFEKLYRKENGDVNAVARKTGLTQSYITNRLRLLKLDLGIQVMLDRGEINITAAQIISSLNHDHQRRLASRASKMKIDDLRAVVEKMKNPAAHPPVSKNRQRVRITKTEEKFTRSWSLKKLDEMGDAAWISISYLKKSFDDVCLDSCLEQKDETLCQGCPVPRFIAAIVRHKERNER